MSHRLESWHSKADPYQILLSVGSTFVQDLRVPVNISHTFRLNLKTSELSRASAFS